MDDGDGTGLEGPSPAVEEAPGTSAQYAPPDAVEVAFLAAGGFGYAQKQAILLMGLAYFACAAGVELPVFIGSDADRTVVACAVPTPEHTKGHGVEHNVSTGLQLCPRGMTVSGQDYCEERYSWEYADPEKTLSAEFDLVCDRRVLASSVGSMLFFGVLCGNLAFTPVPDSIGRCRAFLIGNVLATVSTAVCAASHSFSLYLFGRFLLGFAQACVGVTAYIVAIEVVDATHTSLVMVTMMIMWAVGTIATVCVAFIFPRWRFLSWIHCLLFLFLTIVSGIAWQLGWESPRWLASKGNMSGFNRVMGVMARKNDRGDDFQLHIRSQNGDGSSQAKDNQDGASAMSVNESFQAVVCRAPLSFYSCLYILGFCTCSLGYYGLSLSIENLGWDLYLAAAVNALVEIPACLGAQRLADLPLTGRRGTLASSMLFSGCCCIFSAMLSSGSMLSICIAMLGKMLVTVSYNVIYLQVGEVYPACVSGIAFGIFQTCSRVTGVAAPIVAALPAPLPRLVAGTAAVAVAFPLLGLPETRGQPIPTTLEDVWSRAGSDESNAKSCLGRTRASSNGNSHTSSTTKRRYAHFLEEDASDRIGSEHAEARVVGQPTANADWI
mmetsp:Transcript_49601/g.91520  ORF Transcript_49601/g.91520 Transcript_49601/m.91520 type:complete len:608 (-) Transcript_49601:46-1869(-)